MDNDEEIWKPLPAAPNHYSISSLGRVVRTAPARGTRVGRLLRPERNQDGYLMIQPYFDGHSLRCSIHRQVAIAFIGEPPEPGLLVRHLDDDKDNNAVANLAWGTIQDNATDARRNGSYATRQEHRRLREACRRGHAYTPENTRLDRGKRVCRTCQNERARASYRQKTGG